MGRSSSVARAVALVAAVVAVSACSWAPSDFAKTAGEAASTLAAAEMTLRLRHDGRLTLAYARGSFVNYRDALAGLEDKLARVRGATESSAVEALRSVFREARPALEAPCLADDCDWRSQLDALARAREAFVAAAEE